VRGGSAPASLRSLQPYHPRAMASNNDKAFVTKEQNDKHKKVPPQQH
jgi:hypothetical protein